MVDIVTRIFEDTPLGSSLDDKHTADTIKNHGSGLLNAFDKILRTDDPHDGTIIDAFTTAAANEKNRDFSALAEKVTIKAQYALSTQGQKGVKIMRDALNKKIKALPKEEKKTVTPPTGKGR